MEFELRELSADQSSLHKLGIFRTCWNICSVDPPPSERCRLPAEEWERFRMEAFLFLPSEKKQKLFPLPFTILGTLSSAPILTFRLSSAPNNGEWGMIEIESSGAAHGCLCLDGSTASVFREAQFLIHLCSDRTVC